MAVFMFWNTAGKHLYEQIARICHDYEVDIAIFAESDLDSLSLLSSLNANTRQTYIKIPQVTNAIDYYTRFPSEWFEPRYDDDHISIKQIRIPIAEPLLLVAAHLPSKLFASDNDQIFHAQNLSRTILAEEEIAGHRRTLVIGDFNMDPYSVGMTIANGLHSIMDRSIANNIARVVQKQRYEMFYNPMWSRLGDASEGPPGTYF